VIPVLLLTVLLCPVLTASSWTTRGTQVVMPSAPPLDVSTIQTTAQQIRQQVSRVVVGKDQVVDLLLIALFCEGHVLLEDVPGIGKTTLAKTLARCLHCSFSRIQFTPDLLPSDITGVNVFNQRDNAFEYRPGPI